jgi:hypothetical protein
MSGLLENVGSSQVFCLKLHLQFKKSLIEIPDMSQTTNFSISPKECFGGVSIKQDTIHDPLEIFRI